MGEVAAYKGKDGSIYVEYEGTDTNGDEFSWCERHEPADGWYAAQDFQAIAIGASDPFEESWEGGDSVPADAVRIACAWVDCNMTREELCGTMREGARELDPEFARAFDEIEVDE